MQTGRMAGNSWPQPPGGWPPGLWQMPYIPGWHRLRSRGKLGQDGAVGDLVVGGEQHGLGEDEAEDLILVEGEHNGGAARPGNDAQVAVVRFDEDVRAAEMDLVGAELAPDSQETIG